MRATQHTKEIGGNPDYYLEYTLTNLYVEKTFGGHLSTINITNDSTAETVSFSYDGATLAGEVKPGESVTVNVDQRSSIYVKGSVGADNCRIWGWAGVVKASSTVNPDGSINILQGFEIPPYDDIVLTYVAAGNGAGEVETVTFKSSTVTVAVLTLSYNADDEVSRVQRTT